MHTYSESRYRIFLKIRNEKQKKLNRIEKKSLPRAKALGKKNNLEINLFEIFNIARRGTVADSIASTNNPSITTISSGETLA
jgi:hypothetical protein